MPVVTLRAYADRSAALATIARQSCFRLGILLAACQRRTAGRGWLAKGRRRLTYSCPVPRRSSAYLTPAAWLSEAGVWPEGPFVDDAPAAVGYAAAWARNLEAALVGINKSDLCRRVGLKRDTLYDILNGATWADTVTLVKLEVELGVTLWPARPPV